MIYAISDGSGNVKIGYTGNEKSLRSRRSNLGIANAARLDVLAVGAGDVEHEAALHELLAQYHVRGEWFSDSEWMDPLMRNVIRLLGWKGAPFVLEHTKDQLRNFSTFPCVRPPRGKVSDPGKWAGVRIADLRTNAAATL